MADRLGLDIEELHEVITQISPVSVMALEEVVGSDESEQRSLLDTLADAATSHPTAALEGQEMRGLLSAAINSLSEREKIVVTLYYFEGLTLSEIGDILGVTGIQGVPDPHEGGGTLRNNLVDQDE